MTKEDKRVGYRSPPPQYQWQKGQSGNPKGRRKGQRNLKTDLIEELGRPISVMENGVRRKFTKQRALAAKLVNGAIQGDPRLSLALLRLLAHLLPDTEPIADVLSSSDETIIAEFFARNRSPQEDGQ